MVVLEGKFHPIDQSDMEIHFIHNTRESGEASNSFPLGDNSLVIFYICHVFSYSLSIVSICEEIYLPCSLVIGLW
jgi:hypothetical protein